MGDRMIKQTADKKFMKFNENYTSNNKSNNMMNNRMQMINNMNNSASIR